MSSIHAAYREAGSEVLQANTFSGNRLSLGAHGLGEEVAAINRAGVELARGAADGAWVVASVGCTGHFLEPAGEMTFEEMYQVFLEQLKELEGAGASYVHLETFTDLAELRAALLAARQGTNLQVLASATFDQGGRTLSGNPAGAIAIVAEALGAICVGANCGGGPDTLIGPVQEMAKVTALPLMAKANAGLPEIVDGETVFPMHATDFAATAPAFLEAGVRLIGGCCGTTPEHIRALGKAIEGQKLVSQPQTGGNYLCSPYQYVAMEDIEALPQVDLARKDLHEAASDGDVYALLDAIGEEATDNALLVDFAGFTQKELIWELMSNLPLSVHVPLVFCAEDDEVLRLALRYYPGRPGIVHPTPTQRALAEEYGAVVLE